MMNPAVLYPRHAHAPSAPPSALAAAAETGPRAARSALTLPRLIDRIAAPVSSVCDGRVALVRR